MLSGDFYGQFGEDIRESNYQVFLNIYRKQKTYYSEESRLNIINISASRL